MGTCSSMKRWAIRTKFIRINFSSIGISHTKSKRQKGIKNGVVGFFLSPLKPLGHLAPNLAEMFIWWCLKKFILLVNRKYTKETGHQKVFCLFLFVECLFFNQFGRFFLAQLTKGNVRFCHRLASFVRRLFSVVR